MNIPALTCLLATVPVLAQELALPVQLHVEGLPPGTRIAFTLNCRLEARDYLATALTGQARAAPVLGTDGPWKDDFRIQAGLDARQGRSPFIFHLPSGPKNAAPGTLPTAVFEIAYEYQAPGWPLLKRSLRVTRIDPRRLSAPLALHFFAKGTMPDGSPGLIVGVYPLGMQLN